MSEGGGVLDPIVRLVSWRGELTFDTDRRPTFLCEIVVSECESDICWCVWESMYVCMYVCVCMCVCMYVCMCMHVRKVFVDGRTCICPLLPVGLRHGAVNEEALNIGTKG